MKKKDLQAAAGISPSSISKLSKNEYVSMDVLVKVCTALGVDFKAVSYTHLPTYGRVHGPISVSYTHLDVYKRQV